MDQLGHIWIVDDDVVTLQALQRLLGNAGYLIETFDGVRSVLARLAAPELNGTRVGLAILDVNLQDGTGPALFDRLRRRFPAASVLYCTAQEPPPIIPGARVLQKPLHNYQELLSIVWAALKQASVTDGFQSVRLEVQALAGQVAQQADRQFETVAKLEEAILACSHGIRDIRSNCVTHTATIDTRLAAGAAAADARIDTQINALTLPTVTVRWWSRLDPLTRRILVGAGGAIVFCAGLLLASTRLSELPSLQHKVEYEIEPAVRDIRLRTTELRQEQVQVQQGLQEVLRRLPPPAPKR